MTCFMFINDNTLLFNYIAALTSLILTIVAFSPLTVFLVIGATSAYGVPLHMKF